MDDEFTVGTFYVAQLGDDEPITGFVTATKQHDDGRLLVKLSLSDEGEAFGNWYPAECLTPIK